MKIFKRAFLIYILLIKVSLYSQNMFPFAKDTLWGYQNENKEIIILPQYQYAKKFVKDYAIVYKNDSAGLINKKNEIILPFKFNYIRQISANTFMYGFQSKYYGEFNSGIINTEGKRLTEPLYYDISFKNNRYFVNQKKDSIISKIGDDDLRQVKSNYGMLDENGEILIPAKYDWMEFVDEDLIRVSIHKSSLEAIFDVNGKQITDFSYMVIGQFYDGFSNVRKGDKYGYIDKNGKEFLIGKYEYINPFYKGKAIVSKKRGDKIFYMIDIKGNIIKSIEADYEELKKILQKDNLELMIDEFRFMNRKE